MNIGLSQMRKLKILDLSNNCLQGKIPQALGSLNHLEEVYFQGNEKLESGMANTLCWRHSGTMLCVCFLFFLFTREQISWHFLYSIFFLLGHLTQFDPPFDSDVVI